MFKFSLLTIIVLSMTKLMLVCCEKRREDEANNVYTLAEYDLNIFNQLDDLSSEDDFQNTSINTLLDIIATLDNAKEELKNNYETIFSDVDLISCSFLRYKLISEYSSEDEDDNELSSEFNAEICSDENPSYRKIFYEKDRKRMEDGYDITLYKDKFEFTDESMDANKNCHIVFEFQDTGVFFKCLNKQGTDKVLICNFKITEEGATKEEYKLLIEDILFILEAFVEKKIYQNFYVYLNFSEVFRSYCLNENQFKEERFIKNLMEISLYKKQNEFIENKLVNKEACFEVRIENFDFMNILKSTSISIGYKDGVNNFVMKCKDGEYTFCGVLVADMTCSKLILDIEDIILTNFSSSGEINIYIFNRYINYFMRYCYDESRFKELIAAIFGSLKTKMYKLKLFLVQDMIFKKGSAESILDIEATALILNLSVDDVLENHAILDDILLQYGHLIIENGLRFHQESELLVEYLNHGLYDFILSVRDSMFKIYDLQNKIVEWKQVYFPSMSRKRLAERSDSESDDCSKPKKLKN